MFEIRNLKEKDIPLMVAAFSQIGWNKPTSLFQHYFDEQKQEKRFVWVAFNQNDFLGYVTLKLNSEYLPFVNEKIPEINDLNVLPHFRKQGLGSALLKVAEKQASLYCDYVGIGVGLYADYGNAQKLYVKKGYIPDGRGVTYQYKAVVWDHDFKVDDDLVLWFIKKLSEK